MLSIDRTTGRTISGFDVYAQRVIEVMTTGVNERIKRRKVGSKVPFLTGKTLSENHKMLARAWAANAYYNDANQIKDDADLLSIDVLVKENGFHLVLDFLYNGEIKRVTSPAK